jgi:hypothetical protein
MLDTFTSVGVTRFDLTRIDIDGEKRGFRPQQSMGQLSNFPGAEARRNNIIIRPRSGKAFTFRPLGTVLKTASRVEKSHIWVCGTSIN